MIDNLITSDWITILTKLCLALLLGGILGFERERKLMPAGLRTHILVCLGATLVMMTNQYIADIYQINDISRMGAQVISGIGFLGAGTIIVTRNNRVHGLTTAAGLWASACVGLAIGIGYYSAAILCGILIFITLSFLQWIDQKASTVSRYMNVYLELTDISMVRSLLDELSNTSIQTSGLQIHSSKDTSSSLLGITLALELPDSSSHDQIIASLIDINGVVYAKEI